MEIRQLRYFIEVAKFQNYTKAAKNLFISQPTLSWNIKNLEEELGVKLFEYYDKKLVITRDGENLYTEAIPLLNEHQRIVETFQSTNNGLKGHLEIGVPELFASCFFIDPIMKFMEQYPDVNLTMVHKGSIAVQEMVENESLDIGIVSYIYPSDDLNTIEFPEKSYSLVLVTSKDHPLSTRKSVSFSDLKDESFILLTNEFTLGKLPIRLAMDEGYSPNVMFRSSQWNIICEAVANSLNVTVLPLPLAKRYNKNDITLIPIDLLESTIPVGLITKKNKPMNLPLQYFIQFLIDDALNPPSV